MKKLVVGLIVAFLIILSAGGVYYWQYTKSPRYSLLQAKNAFEQHDLNNFEKYVDVEGITNSLIDQLLEISTEKEQLSYCTFVKNTLTSVLEEKLT